MKTAARRAKAPNSRLMAIPSTRSMLLASPLLAVNLIDAALMTATNRAQAPGLIQSKPMGWPLAGVLPAPAGASR